MMNDLRQFRNTPYYLSQEGRIYRKYKATKTKPERFRELRTPLDTHGYPRVHLSINSKSMYSSLHILVAIVFLGERPEDKTQVNHKNGIKTDARAVNLEWVTNKENVDHAWETGLITRHPVKFTEKDILFMRNSDLTHKEIGKIYNISKYAVVKIRLGKTWKHLGGIKKRSKLRKLNKKKVIFIRQSDLLTGELAKMFKVRKETIREVRYGRSWKHVTLPDKPTL